MPIKLTVEVPDELLEKLDSLAAHYSETREQFAQQSIEYCIREGTRVIFDDDTLTPEERELVEHAREEIERGEYVTHEEVMRELDDDLRKEREKGPQEAAE